MKNESFQAINRTDTTNHTQNNEDGKHT